MKATWSQFQTPFGAGAVICSGDRIVCILLPAEGTESIAERVEEEIPGAEERKSGKSLAQRAASQLRDAFRAPSDLSNLLDSLEWPTGTPFQLAVLQACARIPLGEVRSYGQLASEAGFPGRARAAGTVMATNPLPLVIPCHRIVRSDGSVGQFGGGAEMKRRLLEVEGAPVKPAA